MLVSLPARKTSPVSSLALRAALALVLGTVIEDLLSSCEGLEVGERQVTREEVRLAPGQAEGEAVIAVVRNRTLRRFFDPTVAKLETEDQVVVVCHATDSG